MQDNVLKYVPAFPLFGYFFDKSSSSVSDVLPPIPSNLLQAFDM